MQKSWRGLGVACGVANEKAIAKRAKAPSSGI